MKKKFFIVGLGMIGSSYAKRLSELNYDVYGYDIDDKTNELAVSLGYIKDYGLHHLKESDLVILTLYPNDNYYFIKENLDYFKTVKMVTDVSGVKESLIKNIENILPKTCKYLSHHPMAGSEKSGITAANEKVFEGANFLIISDKDPEKESLDVLMKLKKDLKFGHVSIIGASVHDLLISFTSQLPHMIAVALVNSDVFMQTKSFAGDSYRDLTRIANINEHLWTELFISNKNNLIDQMERFSEEFNNLLEALKENEKENLVKSLKNAREKRSGYN